MAIAFEQEAPSRLTEGPRLSESDPEVMIAGRAAALEEPHMQWALIVSSASDWIVAVDRGFRVGTGC